MTLASRSREFSIPSGDIVNLLSNEKSIFQSLKIIAGLTGLVESLLVVISAIGAKYFYFGLWMNTSPSVWPYFSVGLIAGAISGVVFHRRGAYKAEKILLKHGHFRRVVVGFTILFLLLISLGYLLKVANEYSRGWLLVWFLLCVIIISIQRKLVSLTLWKLTGKGQFKKKIAIYGGSALGDKLKRYFNSKDLGVEVVGIFDAGKNVKSPEKSSQLTDGNLTDLIKLAQSSRLDDIIIALPPSQEKQIIEVNDILSFLPVNIHWCSSLVSLNLKCSNSAPIGEARLVNLNRKPYSEWDYFSKTVFDRVGGLVLFIAFLPAMAVISLVVKLSSAEPVFFAQKRHGLNHRIFYILKFRSMTTMDDGNVVNQVSKNDIRVTKVGKFLRRTSLDELPQLWNVVRGDMSLVGPRPHALTHNFEYNPKIEHYAARHKIKPGITGWAQVNGYRGETADPELMAKRVAYDLDYIENWTLWFDFKILFRTIKVLLFNSQVY